MGNPTDLPDWAACPVVYRVAWVDAKGKLAAKLYLTERGAMAVIGRLLEHGIEPQVSLTAADWQAADFSVRAVKP